MRGTVSIKDNRPVHRPGETLETIAGLRLAQRKQGYRFSLDPFLLCGFVAPRPRAKIVDLGTGCGVIALLLARRYPKTRLWGIEIQSDLAEIARDNAARNRLDSQCTILHGDLRRIPALLPAGGFQVVVSNPPFRPLRSGRVSPVLQRALARQELTFALPDLSRAAAYLLVHGGSLHFIHLPERLPEIFHSLTRQRLEPKTMRLVFPLRDAPPELVLIAARKNGRPGLRVLPPLIVNRARGGYTGEVRHLLRAG